MRQLGFLYLYPASYLSSRPQTQKAFIASYEDLLNSKSDDEVAIFVDAVHPTHAALPLRCFAPKLQKLSI